MRRRFLFLCLTMFLAWAARGAAESSVRMEFFFEPGCETCEQISEKILPELETRLGSQFELREYDIGVKTNFIHLLQRMDAAGYSASERAYLVLNERHAFGSPLENPSAFFQEVDRLLNQPVAERCPAPSAENLLQSQYEAITLSVVLIAGLLDGINPCAISTLVFFMSLLAVSKVRNRRLLWMGVSFCLASFLTYLALGLGLLRVLHVFSGALIARAVLDWAMTLLLLVLAFFSLRDAWRFHRNHQAAEITLQLSSRMKARIHRVMHRGLGSGSVVAGGLLIGAAVTLLESVCTGQVYVPTLVYILKNSMYSESRAWLYLLAYNLLFTLPLVIVFIAVYQGLRTETLLAWSRRNVVVSKTLLGGLFLFLAGLFFLL